MPARSSQSRAASTLAFGPGWHESGKTNTSICPRQVTSSSPVSSLTIAVVRGCTNGLYEDIRAAVPTGPRMWILATPASPMSNSRPGRPATAAGPNELSRMASRSRCSFRPCSNDRRCRPSEALKSSRRPPCSKRTEGDVPSSPVPSTMARNGWSPQVVVAAAMLPE